MLFPVWLFAQNYDADWAAINKRLEAGDSIPVKEVGTFLEKYKERHKDYPDNTTQLYSLLGNNYSQLGNYEKAEENYLLSLERARLSRDTSLKHIVSLSLAILNQNAGNYQKAEGYYLSCMAGMAAVYGQTSREYTELFYYYTSLLMGLGKHSDANPYVDALLYYYKTLDGENNLRYLTLRFYKGIILQQLGDYRGAETVFKEEIKSKRMLKLGDSASHVTAWSNLGDLYREAGDYNEGTRNLENAAELYKSLHIRDPHLKATIANNLGLCYKNLDQPQKAEKTFDEAMSVYEANQEINSESYCTTLSNKASLYTDLGRFGEATELLWTAIEIRKKYFGENNVNYANALANLANAFFGAGYYEKSLEKNLEANAIYLSTVGEAHQAYANNLNSLSLCYLQLNDLAKAAEYKEKALRTIENTVGKNHYRYASFLISAAELYRLSGQNKKAETALKEAMQLVERNLGKQHELYARAQFALAETYSMQNNYEAASAFYLGSTSYFATQLSDYFDAMSEGNQLSLIAQVLPVFESYNNFVMHYPGGTDLSGHLKRAFEYQMLLRSVQANRSAQLRRELLSSKDATVKAVYAEWLQTKNDLMNRYKDAERADDNNDLIGRISQLETQLKSGLKSFSTRHPVTYEQLTNSLSEEEAVVVILRVDELSGDKKTKVRYGALLARKNKKSPDLIVFAEGAKFDSVYFGSYELAINEQLSDTVSYDRYFRALAGSLGNDIKRVYLSSDGVYHKLSYAGLYDPDKKIWLGDRFEIFQVSNPALLVNRPKTPATPLRRAVLFGYPDYDYDFSKKLSPTTSVAEEQTIAKRFGLSNLAKLPGTKKEVLDISATLKATGWETSQYLEQFASEANVRAVRAPGVLHIATHGFYLKDIETEDKFFLGFDKGAIRRDAMLRSGLILAGAGPATQDSARQDSQNDGILTAAEASLLDLSNTDLVVLSACQTGLGDDFGTEGVAGLQRSFAIAGARNIIMSLWPVDDQATQALMTHFYKNYASGTSVETSFRLAQAEVRKTYPHPSYWAAFVLLKTFN